MSTMSFGRRSVLAALTQGVPQEETTVTSEGKAPAAGGEDTVSVERVPLGAAPPAPGWFAPAAEKYEARATVGRGGMGEVLLVEDKDLRREIAMKVLSPQKAEVREEQLKFVAEAQATAQLEHPGIPPIHDIGITPAGEVYFTMKLVRGRTLREVLRDLLLGRIEVRREWTLHRLVTVLERMAEAVHFAHEKGVIHRDLKPENVMLGDYGEVHVMDWGIARVAGDYADEGAEPVSTAETDVGPVTVEGTIKGTPAYMSPEQAAGQISRMDRRSDVYALGCILYEMLSLYQAFEGKNLGEILVKVRTGSFPAVETRNPRREVSPGLAAVSRKAMALLPEARHPTSRAFAEDLRGWLDGRLERERRRKDALTLVERGRKAAAKYEELRRERASAEDRVEAASARFHPWQSLEEKRELIEAEKRMAGLRREAVLAFAETTRLLEGALLAEEENEEARDALADLWRGRLLEAEERGDGDDAAYALERIRHYDRGRLAGFVSGEGVLSLETSPPGARAVIYRLLDRDGVLVAGEEREAGTTPLREVALPMGSYLVVLFKEGCRPLRYPVHVTRSLAWRGRARLFAEGEIGEEFVLVPGGPFVSGEGRKARVVEVADFAIQRMPVTFGDYGRFLAALEAERGAEAAAARIPGTRGDGPYMERRGDGSYGPLPVNVEGPARERCIAQYGEAFEERLAVAGVSFEDASAYCEWKSRGTGREWRLPTEEEREKAARGVDGRRFPWGERVDASLGKCRDSRPEHPQPEPVGAFPTAVSVYGVVDAAGGTWDWTSTWADEKRVARVRKGGAWNAQVALLACAVRGLQMPGERSGVVGFRCARGLG